MLTLTWFATLMGAPSSTEAAGVPAQGVALWDADRTPQLQGPLSAWDIRAGLDAVQPAVDLCFRALHALHRDQVGTAELRFTVQTSGVPQDVQADSERIQTPWFQECLKDAIGTARFAEAQGATSVAWTLWLDEAAFEVHLSSLIGTGGLGTSGAKARDASQPPLEAGSDSTRVGADPIVLGALDKGLIDEVIRQNMSKIRYCYQRELVKDPHLRGEITVKFVIAGDGTVSAAETKSSTMNNPAAESCLSERFLSFQFAAPRGGGSVVVSYPFVFEPG